MAQTDANGNVAIRYYSTIPHTIIVSGYEYAFIVRANICMAWVKAGDVGKVLAITKTCCGGHHSHVYHEANEDDVRRWTSGGGR